MGFKMVYLAIILFIIGVVLIVFSVLAAKEQTRESQGLAKGSKIIAGSLWLRIT